MCLNWMPTASSSFTSPCNNQMKTKEIYIIKKQVYAIIDEQLSLPNQIYLKNIGGRYKWAITVRLLFLKVRYTNFVWMTIIFKFLITSRNEHIILTSFKIASCRFYKFCLCYKCINFNFYELLMVLTCKGWPGSEHHNLRSSYKNENFHILRKVPQHFFKNR